MVTIGMIFLGVTVGGRVSGNAAAGFAYYYASRRTRSGTAAPARLDCAFLPVPRPPELPP